MALKKRLVMAFVILLLVPVILFSVAGVAIYNYQQQAIQESYEDEAGAPNEHIYDRETAQEHVRSSAKQVAYAFVVITFVTAMVLVVWLYGSIIKPLNVLTEATKRVRDGDLDFTISGDPEDELGQLCEDFEEMRVHLKEQIDTRLQYEKDTVELISNISHDLKTPITAIKGYAEGLMDGVADTEEKRNKYIRTIYTKASDMTSLVDELSFYTKIDSNIVTYNFDRIGVNEYFHDCVDDLSLDMEVKNILLGFDSDLNDNVMMLADAEQLRRVINNVIGNSVKYMDKDCGRIEIRAKELAGHLQIEIEDNGAGVEEKDIPYLFDRFYRADASRNSKKGGTGLGLAIAAKIISDHGGRIWAIGEPQKGTTILFTLQKWTDPKEDDSEIQDAEYVELPNRIGKPIVKMNNLTGENKHGKDTDN